MSWVLFILTIPLLGATAVILIEVLVGARPARPQSGEGFAGAIAVLIPAHNEAAGLGPVLDALGTGRETGITVLVVADNCTDDTAAVARAHGATVVERQDATLRGKGYALAFGRERLAQDVPSCVVVLDADTLIEPDGVRRLAAQALATGRPVQATYVLEPRGDASGVVRLSAAAFFVKNMVRPLGAKRLGTPALLTGSGMAFGWSQFAALPLATGHVAEDMMLGVVAALDDRPPLFMPDVVVTGATSSASGTGTQRRRWESGGRETAREFAGRLVAAAFARARPGLGWLALDLLVPPLMLLLALDVAASAALLAFGLLGASMIPFWILTLTTAALVAAVPLSIVSHGRGDLLTGWREVPGYVMWKVKLSIAVLLRRERQWIRTERD